MLRPVSLLYRALRFRLKIDPEEIRWMNSVLKRGDHAVDIGAHKGAYLFWMRANVGEQGKIFGFEPQVKLFHSLYNLTSRKFYHNLQLENLGVSDQPGETTFYIPNVRKGDSPGARIGLPPDSSENIELSIRLTSLDEYFFRKGIAINFLKIDVEGHELEVLTGGKHLIQTSRPYILLECENRHLSSHTVADVLNLLTEWGYKGYFFRRKEKVSISSFDPDKDQAEGPGSFWEAKNYVNNFIFEPES